MTNSIKENKAKFHIGQDLWFKSEDRRIAVEKDRVITVGRKYVTTENQKTIDLENLHWIEKGYGRQGRFFFSEQELDENIQQKANLTKIRSLVDYSTNPNDYTVEQTEAVIKILTINDDHH